MTPTTFRAEPVPTDPALWEVLALDEVRIAVAPRVQAEQVAQGLNVTLGMYAQQFPQVRVVEAP